MPDDGRVGSLRAFSSRGAGSLIGSGLALGHAAPGLANHQRPLLATELSSRGVLTVLEGRSGFLM